MLRHLETASSWLLDSDASHHVTNDLNDLCFHAPYDGTIKLLIGDGMGLKISHIGSLSLSTLALRNVLVVPSITKHIISISQLRKDNPVSINFSSTLFSITDHQHKSTFFQGLVNQGVYEVKLLLGIIYSFLVFQLLIVPLVVRIKVIIIFFCIFNCVHCSFTIYIHLCMDLPCVFL